MCEEQDDKPLERRVVLPEPDVDNITVLTESLPNDPVLPWHHFDSPWLEREVSDDAPPAEAERPADPQAPDSAAASPPTPGDEPLLAEQLTLALEPVS